MTTNNATNWNTLYGIYYGNHMVDNLTDTVFFSDLLPERCPTLYQSLDKILKGNDIDHRLLSHTKDIWCRDYMPIQTSEKRFVFYKYNPDYLQTKYYQRTITDVNRVGNIECLRQDGEVVDLDLVIDGGNVVRCDDKIVMTEKVFFENKDKSRNEVQRLLEEAFERDIIFLPWDRKEIFGHSDGIVHYVGDNRLLITNYEEIEAAYRKAAEMGQPEAQCFLGEWYYYGERELAVDIGETYKWWRKAAERGYYQAQYKIGDCYDFGRGVERDTKEAVKWFKRSASKDYIPAVYALGLCYYFGNGVRKNKKEALKCFKRAAKYDYAEAIYMIGYYYYDEIVDEEEAIRYYKRAAELGCKRAAEILSRVLMKSEEPRYDDVPF